MWSRSVQKQGLEERQDIKSRIIIEIFTKTASKTESLIDQGDFGKIIDVVWRNLCFVRVYLGNVMVNVML